MSEPDAPRFAVAKTLLAMAWFSAMFFVAGPWLVLWAAGVEIGERLASASPWAWLPLGVATAGVAWIVARFVERGRGTPVPLDPPRRFVRDTLWARTRNPMYLAYAAVVAAEAWLLRSGALAAYGVGFFALMHAYVTLVEEPGLERRFGDAYRRYCEEVPRWLDQRSFARADR